MPDVFKAYNSLYEMCTEMMKDNVDEAVITTFVKKRSRSKEDANEFLHHLWNERETSRRVLQWETSQPPAVSNGGATMVEGGGIRTRAEEGPNDDAESIVSVGKRMRINPDTQSLHTDVTEQVWKTVVGSHEQMQFQLQVVKIQTNLDKEKLQLEIRRINDSKKKRQWQAEQQRLAAEREADISEKNRQWQAEQQRIEADREKERLRMEFEKEKLSTEIEKERLHVETQKLQVDRERINDNAIRRQWQAEQKRLDREHREQQRSWKIEQDTTKQQERERVREEKLKAPPPPSLLEALQRQQPSRARPQGTPLHALVYTGDQQWTDEQVQDGLQRLYESVPAECRRNSANGVGGFQSVTTTLKRGRGGTFRLLYVQGFDCLGLAGREWLQQVAHGVPSVSLPQLAQAAAAGLGEVDSNDESVRITRLQNRMQMPKTDGSAVVVVPPLRATTVLNILLDPGTQPQDEGGGRYMTIRRLSQHCGAAQWPLKGYHHGLLARVVERALDGRDDSPIDRTCSPHGYRYGEPLALLRLYTMVLSQASDQQLKLLSDSLGRQY